MEVGPKVIVIPNNESENPRFSMSPDRKQSLAANPMKLKDFNDSSKVHLSY